MKALVTGANGFIGSHLVEELLAQKCEVTCLVRQTSNLRWVKDLPVHFEFGNVTDYPSLLNAVKGKNRIFHCGGIVRARDENEFFRVNAEGTKNLLQAILENANQVDRFIYLSSQAAAGPSDNGVPISEENFPSPVSLYGKSKLEGENFVHQFSRHYPTTIIRPPSVYGPRDEDFLAVFKQVKFGIKAKIGRREKKISLVHVSDLVRGIVLAAMSHQAINETFFITNQEDCFVGDLVNLIAGALGKKGISITVPEFFLAVAAFVAESLAHFAGKAPLVNRDKVRELRQQYWLIDGSKAEKLLRFKPKIALKDGIIQTCRWYCQQGWL